LVISDSTCVDRHWNGLVVPCIKHSFDSNSGTSHYVSKGEIAMPTAMTHAFHNAYLIIALLGVAGALLATTLKRPAKDGIGAAIQPGVVDEGSMIA
jgi:hypothetical protein